MERRQIEYFIAVIDHGGFTAAAEALHIAQPSLSHSIKVLERELGAELFHRLPRGVRLTSAGEAFVTSARQALRDLETGRESVREVAGLMRGRLDLASLPTLTLDPLASVIGRFRHDHPEVSLQLLQPEQRSAVRESVVSGHAELGFVADTDIVPDPELHSIHIGWQELVVTMPPNTERTGDGPLTMEEVLNLDLITGQTGTFARDLLIEQARQHKHELNLVLEVSQRESGVHLVAAGAGSALLPTPLARIATLDGAVLASMSPPLWREVRLLRRPGPPSPAARAFQDALLEDVHQQG